MDDHTNITTIEDLPEAGLGMKILWGGLGALAPILLSIGMKDYADIGSYLAAGSTEGYAPLAGYATRTLALFAAGALVVAAQSMPKDAWKMLQMGIFAPAMLTTALNTNSTHLNGETDGPLASFSIISAAHAELPAPASLQTQTGENQDIVFKCKKGSAYDKFKCGFLGK